MKLLKKNQVIIYVIAVMLMAAGYLNYTTNQENNSVATSMQMEANDDTQLADIGDATLVSSNDVIEETKETDTKNPETKETEYKKPDNTKESKEER